MDTRQDSLQPDAPTEISGSLDAHRAALQRRLEDGYSRIDDAALAGKDVGEWEDFWVSLLREYEDVCRDLYIAA